MLNLVEFLLDSEFFERFADSVEVFLSVGPNLGSTTSPNMLFDQFPLFSVKSAGLDEQEMLLPRPATEYKLFRLIHGFSWKLRSLNEGIHL